MNSDNKQLNVSELVETWLHTFPTVPESEVEVSKLIREIESEAVYVDD
jgi:hypothetical protein